jgi:PAS domain S-box-containing protein
MNTLDWRKIFNSIIHPSCIIDIEHIIIEANNAVLKKLNMPIEKIKGEKCYKIFHDTLAPPDGCPAERLIKSNIIETVEIEMETLSGTYLVSCTPLSNERDIPKFFLHIATDISKQKIAEQELSNSQRFLSNIFESIQDGISILDIDMNIIRVNKTMEQWYAHAMPITGKKCFQAYHGRDKHCDICPSIQTLKTGKNAYEIVPRRGPESKITGWLDLYSFPLVDTETGEIKGVIEYVRDITRRKQVEEELQQRVEELEKFYEMAVNRELKMKKLKDEVARLKEELSRYIKP